MEHKDEYFLHHKAFLDDPNSLLVESNDVTEHKINNFMSHGDIYFIIISIQLLDIILNFFIMNNLAGITDPFEVAKNYMQGNFLPDLIAIIPYST
jgi:hypothetical protein